MFCDARFIIIFLIYDQLKASQGSSRLFDIRWTKANCTIIDNSVVNLFVCPIKELPENRGNYLEVYFETKQDIEHLTMDFRVTVPTSKNKEIDILKIRTDACKLSTFQSKNPIVTAVFKNILNNNNNNIPKTCPFKANSTYTMKQFALNPNYFPGYTPEMNFTTRINLYIDKKHLIYVNIAASIRKISKIK